MGKAQKKLLAPYWLLWTLAPGSCLLLVHFDMHYGRVLHVVAPSQPSCAKKASKKGAGSLVFDGFSRNAFVPLCGVAVALVEDICFCVASV